VQGLVTSHNLQPVKEEGPIVVPPGTTLGTLDE